MYSLSKVILNVCGCSSFADYVNTSITSIRFIEFKQSYSLYTINHTNNYEKIPLSEIVSNEGHFDNKMCVINLSVDFWPNHVSHLGQTLRCLFIYTYQIHVSATVDYFKYKAFLSTHFIYLLTYIKLIGKTVCHCSFV